MSQTQRHRFFSPNVAIGEVELPEGEARHAASVLRLRAGDVVELFDGMGRRADARVIEAGKRRVLVAVDNVELHRRPRPAIHLAFAVPKGKRLDWLLEKATELGAASLTPVTTQRSVAGGDELTGNKRERWLTHCLAAAKQCGLDYLPDIREMTPLADLLSAERGAAGLRLLGDPSAVAKPIASALPTHLPDDVTILVGPEGGLTLAEHADSIASGFVPVRLGTTVLRVETAAIALLAAVTSLTHG